MLPPMRPRPIMPICMATLPRLSSCCRPAPVRRRTFGVYTQVRAPALQEANPRGGTEMRPRRWLPVATGGILMTSLSAASTRGQAALRAKAGSLGLGLELTVGLSPQLNARLGANGFNYTDDHRRVSQIEYNATARLRRAPALLDWRPGGGGFRLSGGLVYNDTRIAAHSLPPASGIYDIG